MAPQKVVIVGSGSAGLNVWNFLSANLAKLDKDGSKYELILINPQPFFVHRPATVRVAVTSDGNLEDLAWIPLLEKFNKGINKLVIGSVTSVVDNGNDGGHVVLNNGEEIQYNVLVVATGSIWEGHLAFPDGKDNLKSYLSSWRNKFEKANDVVIVGGGSIGIETAGEIKDKWPHKNVTIVHGQTQLLNSTYPEKWRSKLEQRTRALGIQLILNDYVDETEVSVDNTITTRKQQTIPADLLVQARGPKPNTRLLQSLGADTLSTTGNVKIKPTLQLVNHPRIFAVGDIIDWPEQKQAGKTMSHGPIAGKNVLSLLLGNEPAAVYKGSVESIVITLGKSHGYGYVNALWGITLPNWLSVYVKSKKLLLNFVNGMMGFP